MGNVTLSIEQYERIYCSNLTKNQKLLKMKSFLEELLLQVSLQRISELMIIAQKLEEINTELDKLPKKELNKGVKKATHFNTRRNINYN